MARIAASRLIASLAVALAAVTAVIPSARAQVATDYPNRVVRLVVGFAAGGGNDILARVLSEKFAAVLGQSVIVDNRPGAGGMTAAQFVMREPPDGYTLLVGASGAMAIAPAVYTRMGYDTLKNFAPISNLGSYPLVLLVAGDSPFRTARDFIDWTKANKGTGNYSSSSPAFTIATELFKLKTGADLQRVSYRSSNDSAIAVLSRQTNVTLIDPLPAVGLVADGKVRALATTSPTRIPEMPNVPTMAEAGVPDMDVVLWTGLFAPAGTPAPVLAKLEAACRQVLADPAVRARLRDLATDAVGSSAAEFRSQIEADIRKWRDVATKADVKIDP